VRAEQHRREGVVASGGPPEDVAHLVDADRESGGLEPVDQRVARSRVRLGERRPVHAAAFRRADLVEPVEPVSEPLAGYRSWHYRRERRGAF